MPIQQKLPPPVFLFSNFAGWVGVDTLTSSLSHLTTGFLHSKAGKIAENSSERECMFDYIRHCMSILEAYLEQHSTTSQSSMEEGNVNKNNSLF